MNLLTPPAPSVPAIAGFVSLVVAVSGVTVASVRLASRTAGESDAQTRRRTIVVAATLAAWLALTTILAASGLLAQFDRRPPPFLVFVAVSTALSTVFAFSRFGSLLARSLPIAVLVGFHAFRLPLEIILYQLSLDGVLPVQMTFDGMNYDITTGVLAALIGLWASYRQPPRLVLMLWNVLGVFLLLVIVTIAALSAPIPLRLFMNDPANTIVATVPFVWLPTLLVQAAWIGHLLVFRRLRFERIARTR